VRRNAAGKPVSMRATLPIAALLALAAADARAQSEVTIVPAIALGAMYDSNLFSAPTGHGDLLATVRPSVEGRFASPTQRGLV